MEKEERKQQRKARINAKIDGEYAGGSPGGAGTSTFSERFIHHDASLSDKTGQLQVANSIYSLNKEKVAGLQAVTDFRLNIDKSESTHRDEDDSIKRERLSKLQSEAYVSAKANAAVEMRWANLMTKEVPQELHAEIQKVAAECQRIMKVKDNLIQEFQKQLYNKDTDYILGLRSQAKEISEMLTKMRVDFKALDNSYEKEFKHVETAYSIERESLVTDLTAELDDIFEARKGQEQHFKEAKAKREEEYLNEIDDLCSKGADQYNKLKIELELNLQTLNSQLQDIRSTYQLNAEKLDYNYRVLIELDLEKKNELSRYKKRFTKLKDQLNQSLQRFNEVETADSKLNAELTQDYRSLTQKYKNLQSKFRLFEQSDASKYDDVWGMHEEEVKDLLDHLLKADKIITEQQIGMTWVAPDIECLQKVLGKFGKMGTAVDLDHGRQEMGSSNSPNKRTGTQSSGSPTRSPSRHGDRKVSGTRVKAVLKMLAKEAGFLLNNEVQESLNSLSDTEAEIESAEAMLRALGIKNEAGLEKLVGYFFKDTLPLSFVELDDGDEDEDYRLSNPILSNAPEDFLELRYIIKAEDVIRAVKVYLEDMNLENEKDAHPNEDASVSAKRLNSMRNYWESLADIIPNETCNVWKQLVRDYDVLRNLLKKRADTIAEVDELQDRNNGLKILLNRYLGDKDMDASLQIPPALVMSLRSSPDRKSKTLKSPVGSPNKANAKILMSQTR